MGFYDAAPRLSIQWRIALQQETTAQLQLQDFESTQDFAVGWPLVQGHKGGIESLGWMLECKMEQNTKGRTKAANQIGGWKPSGAVLLGSYLPDCFNVVSRFCHSKFEAAVSV